MKKGNYKRKTHFLQAQRGRNTLTVRKETDEGALTT